MAKKTTKLIGIFALALTLVAGMLWSPPAQAFEPFVGQIQMFGFNFPPRGWAHCNGQLLAISTNTALFSLLGTTFGGDGRVSFGLPDLRGRVAIHVGNGPGVQPIVWGQRGGSNSVVLTQNNMPPHTHTVTIRASSAQGTEQGPGGHVPADDRRETQYSAATPDVDMNSAMATVSSAGGGQAFSIMQPFLGIYHSIALVGIFPSRS